MLPLFVFKEENSILVAAMVIYKYNFESENSIVYRRCSPFACTFLAHCTDVDILKVYRCSTLSKFIGYTLLSTISRLKWVDA